MKFLTKINDDSFSDVTCPWINCIIKEEILEDLNIDDDTELDSNEIIGNNEKLNRIFPYGGLRESVVGLRRADLIISTITDEHEDEKNLTLKWAYNDYLLIAGTPENKTEELRSLEQYNNILSLCAIGTPENFQKTLKSLNIHYKQSLVYPDHYPFKEKDINKINAFIEKNKIDIILCTEKDLVKLKQHKKMLGVPLAAITINYSFSEGLEKTY